MTMFRPLLAAAFAAGLLSTPALADRPRDVPQRDVDPRADNPSPEREQQRAFEATRDGRSMPLPKIERRVMPFMGGADYLGPEFDGDTYRLKFMRDGRVIWVDVEASTGRIIRRSRP
jgi:hypothetical protein